MRGSARQNRSIEGADVQGSSEHAARVLAEDVNDWFIDA